MMGRMAAPVMACRINSAWLMLQAESLSANSAYSSSVMRVLPTFVPLYGQKRKMPNAHLDFSSLLRQASPFRANFPVTHYYKGTWRFAKNGSKNLWRCCLEQYSILVSRSLFLVKEKDNRFWLSCENVYYVVLCMIDKIKFEDHSSTKYLYAAASSSPHSLSKLPFSS